jgi:RNA polymerase sigma-70 factor (ECF subfamily)
VVRGNPHAARTLDEAGFDALVRAYAAPLCDFAATLIAVPGDAEELVQDVFASIWMRRDTWDATDPLPYLFGAVRNLARNNRRNAGVRSAWSRTAAAIAAHEGASAESPAEICEGAELARAVSAAIGRLSPQQRLAFTLSRHHGLSYAEIARTIGVSVKTVETQMGRALKSLRVRLAPHLVRSAMIAAIAVPASLLAALADRV